MSTPDPNNVLFQIAHPDLYERNPFNVLNLPVDATAKDIRRRKEDIEAAFDAGMAAAEFANVLPGDKTRKTPTRSEVDELFATLEDPEKRIAYALFWFWPEDLVDAERETNRKRSRNPNDAFGHHAVVATWDRDARLPDGSTSTQFISRHNLAVFHHMMGVTYELELKSISPTDADTPDYVHGHWRSSIYWWNEIAGEPDFWRHVSELVSALDDPRVDYRFARSLRDQFAFAFDQINVELAIDFAKTGRETDAKRQVEYMKLSQPDSDDVEGTFDDAFSGLLRQTEAIVKAARDEAQKSPKDGLKKANEILAQTAEPLRISRIVFEKGAPIRNSIVTTIFAGVRSCLIAYGNSTADWDNCLELTRKLKELAENDEHVKQVGEDDQIIKDNKKKKEEEDRCWFCKQNRSVKGCEVQIPMFGEVQRDFSSNQVRWKTFQLSIPRCQTCKSATSIKEFFLKNSWLLLLLVFGVGGIIFETFDGFDDSMAAEFFDVRHPQGLACVVFSFLDGMVFLIGGWIILMVFLRTFINLNFLSKWLYSKYGPKYEDYPLYVAMKKDGWEEGDGPL